MPLVTTTEMFKKAYEGGYAIGAFNVNNMEIIQGITEAAAEERAPLILQVSAGARKYAKHIYLTKLVEAAIADTDLPIALHLDHGADFDICKACVDGGFSSVMIDGSKYSFEENIALTRKVVEYAHAHGVVVEGELGTLAGIEDDVHVKADDALFTRPEEVEEFVTRTGVDSLAIAIGTSHGAYKFKPGQKPQLRFDILEEVGRRLPGFPIVLHGASSVPQEFVADGQQVRRQYARCHRRARGDAPAGCPDGGVQDQHRLRPASGDDCRCAQAPGRASSLISTPVSTSPRPGLPSRRWSVTRSWMCWAALARHNPHRVSYRKILPLFRPGQGDFSALIEVENPCSHAENHPFRPGSAKGKGSGGSWK